MASAGYRQDMPPKGGYGAIDWAKKVTKVRNGYYWFGGFVLFNGCALVAEYFNQRWNKMAKVEMQDARLAVYPLQMAEQQRMFVTQLRKNRDVENELMKDVENWETGTLFGEPVYHNVRDRFMFPSTDEYYAHTDPKIKKQHVNEKSQH